MKTSSRIFDPKRLLRSKLTAMVAAIVLIVACLNVPSLLAISGGNDSGRQLICTEVEHVHGDGTECVLDELTGKCILPEHIHTDACYAAEPEPEPAPLSLFTAADEDPGNNGENGDNPGQTQTPELPASWTYSLTFHNEYDSTSSIKSETTTADSVELSVPTERPISTNQNMFFLHWVDDAGKTYDPGAPITLKREDAVKVEQTGALICSMNLTAVWQERTSGSPASYNVVVKYFIGDNQVEEATAYYTFTGSLGDTISGQELAELHASQYGEMPEWNTLEINNEVCQFTYEGSDPGSIKLGNNDNKIEMTYRIYAYTITFNDGDNDEFIFEETSGTVRGGEKPSFIFSDESADPVREGYIFKGWTKGLNSYVYSTDALPEVYQDETYYAVWEEIPTRTITYLDGVEGNVLASYEARDGATTPSYSDTPTRAGYKFAGWYPQVTALVDADKQYTATWVPADTYTVTYVDGVDGTAFEPRVFSGIAEKAAPTYFGTTPTRPGYTFDGWIDDLNNEYGPDQALPAMERNVTYTAKWVEGATYRVVYSWTGEAPSGAVPPVDNNVYADGSSFTVDSNYKRGTVVERDQYGNEIAYYTFSGWDFTTDVINGADVQITGSWTKEVVPVDEYSYTITFEDGLGGAVFADQVFENQLGGTPTPTYAVQSAPAGQHFYGWTNGVDEFLANEPLPTISGDEIYTAMWIEIPTYTVTYLWKGEAPVGAILPKDETAYLDGDEFLVLGMYRQGSTITAADANGNTYEYTFDGWTINDQSYQVGTNGTIDGNNIEIVGTWTKHDTPAPTSYYVTYMDGVDETAFADQVSSALAGSATPTFNGTPTREGYTFLGWSPAVEATVTGNVTYVAQWQAVSTQDPNPEQPSETTYTISYVYIENGETITVQTTTDVKAGEVTPTCLVTPEREGYVFVGWSPVVAGTVSADATYVAQWRTDNTPNQGDNSGDNNGDNNGDNQGNNNQGGNNDNQGNSSNNNQGGTSGDNQGTNSGNNNQTNNSGNSSNTNTPTNSGTSNSGTSNTGTSNQTQTTPTPAGPGVATNAPATNFGTLIAGGNADDNADDAEDEETTIEDEENPLAEPEEEDIDDDANPLASSDSNSKKSSGNDDATPFVIGGTAVAALGAGAAGATFFFRRRGL